MIREISKEHQVSTFEVELICQGRDDESGVSKEEDMLPWYKQDLLLYCKPI